MNLSDIMKSTNDEIWNFDSKMILRIHLASIDKILNEYSHDIDTDILWNDPWYGAAVLQHDILHYHFASAFVRQEHPDTFLPRDVAYWIATMCMCKFMEYAHHENRGPEYTGFYPLGDFGEVNITNPQHWESIYYVRDHQYFWEVKSSDHAVYHSWIYNFGDHHCRRGQFANMDEFGHFEFHVPVEGSQDNQESWYLSPEFEIDAYYSQGKFIVTETFAIQAFLTRNSSGYGRGRFTSETNIFVEEQFEELITDGGFIL